MYEAYIGTNYLDKIDDTSDSDGDGVSNLDEIKNGTNPRIPNGAGGTTVSSTGVVIPLGVDSDKD